MRTSSPPAGPEHVATSDSGDAGRRPGRVERAIASAVDGVLRGRREDGRWCYELETDTITGSEYVLLLHFLRRADDPRVEACCRRLRRQQTKAGGWALYPGGPVDPSPSVKAYLCLKLAGDDPEAPHMIAARDAIRRAGGLRACNSYTKLYLSVFGLWSWRRAPSVPPELILLPRWSFVNLVDFSAWSRVIVLAVSVVWALKPHVPLRVDLDELGVGVSVARPRTSSRKVLWLKVFGALDALFKVYEALGPLGLWRRRALRAVEVWMTTRIGNSDGLGGFFPGMTYGVLALRCLGYEESHPLVRSQLEALERLEIEEDGEMRLQPCRSPVWDTALASHALLDAGVDHQDVPIQGAMEWLLDREIRTWGDWRTKSRSDAPGGAWCFYYRNDFYPDCDDTAAVLALLSRIRGKARGLDGRRREAAARAVNWLVGMQNPDGGWGAFDRGCDREILTAIPFADHNAMIDPSTPDVSSRVMAALLDAGLDPAGEPIGRAIRYLLRRQERDGSWPGRWGANHVYGTWLALEALTPLVSRLAGNGRDRLEEPCMRAAWWLAGFQNDDGGWGESLGSYENPGTRLRGGSTAVQTAWAMRGLAAVAGALPAALDRSLDRAVEAALERGCAHLSSTQGRDGVWRDDEWCGVGFPRVLYLRYHGYSRYFPLSALAAYRGLRSRPARA